MQVAGGMVPDSGTLTTLMNKFITVFSLGYNNLLPEAKWILSTLVAIELIFSGLAWAAKGGDTHLALAKKLLPIGFITLLVTTWHSVVGMALGGFLWVGKTAGGGTSDVMSDPSRIIDMGLDVCQPIMNYLTSFETLNPAKALTELFLMGLSMLGILAAFFIIAINVFVTYLEFHIVAVLTAIFVPFGVFKPTAFLSEKALGGVIAQGVKLMVLAFIVAVAQPVLASIVLPASPSVNNCWMTLMSVGAIAMLAVHAPALAGGILSGSPSLSAGSAAGTALGAAAGLAAAGGAAIMGGKAASSAAGAAASGVSRTSGAVVTAGKSGAAAGMAGAAIGGSGKVGQAVGAVSGALGNVAKMAGSKTADAAKSVGSKATSGVRDSFQQGKNDAQNFAPSKIKPGAAGAASSASPGAATPSGASDTAAASKAADGADNATSKTDHSKNVTGNAAKAAEAVKGGDGGGGGMSPTLHGGEE